MLFARGWVAVFAILLSVVLFTSTASAAPLNSFTTTSTTVLGGKSISVTVRLATRAGSGGQVVTFSSSNSYATAPSPVTISSGGTYLTAKFATRSVTRNIAVTLTAESGGVSKDLAVTLTPPNVSTFSTPSKLIAGAQGTAYVYLSAAPSENTEIDISSSDTSVATSPSTVTVLAGKTSASFKVTAGSNEGSVTFTATYNGLSKTDVTVVGFPALTSVSSPTSLVAGKSSTAYLFLSGPVLGDTQVSIVSSNTSIVTVPATVTILNGKTGASFPVVSSGAASGSATITATLRGVSKTDVTVVNPAQVYSFGITRSLDANDATTAKVRLTGKAPTGGLTVTLTASPAGVLTLPSTVVVPEGADFVNVPVTSGAPSSQTTVTVTASANGISKSATTTVKAATHVPVIMSLSTTPSIVGSNSTVKIYVRLDRPAPLGGVQVLLVSSNQTLLPLNKTIWINATWDNAMVTVKTGAVGSATSATITASYANSTLQTEITLKSYAVSSVQLPTGTTVGPASVNGSVNLTGPAPSGGATVTLTSSSPNVTVPSSVVIPAGSSSVTVPLAVGPVGVLETVTITARALGLTTTGQFTIGPSGVKSLSGFNALLNGGQSYWGTVSVTGSVPPEGFTIQLTSSNPSVLQVPATVFLPGGSGTSVGFGYTTSVVSSSSPVTVTATLNGQSAQRSVTVKPAEVAAVLTEYALAYTSTSPATVMLNSPAPTGGLVVQLQSSQPAVASVPATVLVPAGAREGTFEIVTHGYQTSTTSDITITASLNGITRTTPVIVLPDGPESWHWSSGAFPAGRPITNTLTLTGPVHAGGLTLTVSYTAGVYGPTTLDVPEGSTEVVLTFYGYPTNKSRSDTVRVSANGLTKQFTVGPGNMQGTVVPVTTTVTSGSMLDVTVTYPFAAGMPGLSATLVSSNPTIIPSTSFTLVEGEDSVTLRIPVSAATIATTVTLRLDDFAAKPAVTITVVLAPVEEPTEEPTPEPTVVETALPEASPTP